MRALLIILLSINLLSYSQDDLPAIDWNRAGANTKSTEKLKEIDFLAQLEDTEMSTDELIAKLVSDNPDGAIILFPKGEYEFKKQIRLSSNFILRGAGSGYTKLIFKLEKEQSAVIASGKSSGQFIQLSKPVAKGETEIHFETTDLTKYPLVDVGEYVMLIDDDHELITSDWAKDKTGQIMKIVRVGMEGIEVEDAANRSYNMDAHPKIVKVNMVENIGIEKLTIENHRKTEQQTSNIHFTYAYNCWVNGVTSLKANYAHVLYEFSTHGEVRNCTIMDAHDFGNGGKAYGITLQFATSSCLIQGNRLEKLRHAILLQAGANGNVIRANKSSRPYWDGVMLPKNAAGDIVLHGNYPYANLIERNLCQNLVIDNSHGPNGPDNVLFWNDIQGYGIVMNRKAVNGKMYIINNVVENHKGIKGRYRVKGDVYERYNTVRGKIKPKNSDKLDRESLMF